MFISALVFRVDLAAPLIGQFTAGEDMIFT